MEVFFYIIAKSVSVFLGVIMLSMIARMFLPIFVDIEGNALFTFVCVVTELFITPVRAILIAFNIGQNSPIDWAFFISYLILSFIRSALPVI